MTKVATSALMPTRPMIEVSYSVCNNSVQWNLSIKVTPAVRTSSIELYV